MKKIKLDPTVMSSENLAAAFVGACEAGDEKMVDIMLPWVKRTDVNCSDRMGVTALMAALAKDQYEVGGRLLDLPGVDFSLRDIQGKTVLHHLLQSKSLFFFDEIVEEMENILPHEEFNNVLLKKLKECLPVLKDSLTMFKRVLAWYDISFRNNELFTQAMLQAGGDGIILAFQLIYPEDIPEKLSQDGLEAIATAVAAGHTALIGLVLYSHEMVDMVELLSLCREKGVTEDSINKELYMALTLMVYKISPPTHMGYVWEFKMDTFLLGLNLVDINFLDKNGIGNSGPMGSTILMRVLETFYTYMFWSDGVKLVGEILMKKELDLSVMNENGKTALDFLDMCDNYNLIPGKDLRWRRCEKLIEGDLGSQKPRCLLPVVKFEKSIDHVKSSWALDIQLLCLFKKRQDTFKDFDFNDVKQTLLSRAMKACRLDLVRFLLINCNVKVLQCDVEAWSWLCSLEIKDTDWCEVRGVLSRVVEKVALEDPPVINVVGCQPG